MTCDDYAKAWIDQLDALRGPDGGRVRTAPGSDLEAHAASCSACRAAGARWDVLARAIAVWGHPPAADPVAVDRLLARLRPEYRLVFVLYHEHGLPYEEIGRAISRPIGTVKTWLHRARNELADDLTRRGVRC